MEKRSQEKWVWIDLEMTGLDPETCVIIEIAVIITDAPSANAPSASSANSQDAAESSNKVVDLEAGRPRRVKRECKQDVNVEGIDC